MMKGMVLGFCLGRRRPLECEELHFAVGSCCGTTDYLLDLRPLVDRGGTQGEKRGVKDLGSWWIE